MEAKACSVDGCGDASRSKMGFCRKHYAKWKRYGDPLGGYHRAVCAVDGCSELQQSRGYCKIHYARWRYSGDPGQPGRRNFPLPAECTVDGCTTVPKAKGLCGKHLSRLMRHGDPLANPRRPKGSRRCEVIGCDRPYSAKGYCSAHYSLWRDHGDPEPFGYQCAHKKVRRVRGVARDNACAHCGKPAVHWAYDHDDPAERFDPDYGGSYSLDPDHYMPLCASCHKTFDVSFAASRARA